MSHHTAPERHVPSRLQALAFHFKSRVFQVRRGLSEMSSRPPRHECSSLLVESPVIAEKRAPLWRELSAAEFPLTAGKVENLRRSARAFHGVEIPAGQVFSFWRQLGRTTKSKGFTEGREFRNLVLTFHRGRLVSMKADSGDERLQSTYAAAGRGKELFAGIDVGFNPGLGQPPGASLRTFAVAGTVAIAFGSDTWLGGDNDCAFGFSASLAGATLTVDGKALVENGSLVR